MTRFFSIAVLLGVSLMGVNESVVAKGGGGGGSGGRSAHLSGHGHGQGYGSFRSYGYGYRNWSNWCWSGDYGCYFYWCPTACCYYYWYGPASCYYPVAYLRSYPPSVCTYANPGPGLPPIPSPGFAPGSVPPGSIPPPNAGLPGGGMGPNGGAPFMPPANTALPSNPTFAVR